MIRAKTNQNASEIVKSDAQNTAWFFFSDTVYAAYVIR